VPVWGLSGNYFPISLDCHLHIQKKRLHLHSPIEKETFFKNYERGKITNTRVVIRAIYTAKHPVLRDPQPLDHISFRS
jgi:bifunctional ADP-heptose synthase (sugar kinase/adenylyltransferase)